MYRWLSVSVACVVLLHITGCLGVAEEEETAGVESARWKRAQPNSAPSVLGASPPKCITPKGACACQTDQGLIDLSAIDVKDGTKAFFEDIQSGGNTYKFNPCTPFTEMRCSDAAVCQCYSSSYCYSIGTHSGAKFQNDPSTQDLQINYSSGGFYQ